MKSKALNLLDKYKHELGIFVLLCLQALVLNFRSLWYMDENFIVYYLADFSMGKTSRLLIGSIVNLFTDSPTELWLNNFARVVLVLTFVFTAAVVGNAIKNVKEEMRIPAYAVALFFVTGSFTMYSFSRFFGLLDIYMFVFSLLAIVFAQNKYLRWLVPLACLAGVFVNYVYTISYFPVVILVILYFADMREKKAADITVFCITVVSVLAATFFCAFWGKNTMTVSFEEMLELLQQKLGAEITFEQMKYYRYYLFAQEMSGDVLVDATQWTPAEYVWGLLDYVLNFARDNSGVATLMIACLPVIGIFWAVWIMCIRASEKKSRRFVFACFLLSTLFVFVCCILSTDLTRWITAGVLSQFMLCFFMFAVRDEAFEKTMLKLKNYFVNNKLVLIIIFAMYAFTGHLSLEM